MPLAKELRLNLFRKMYQVRRFEQKAIELYQKSLIHGTIHVALGQEASCVGAISALAPTDYVTSNHRGHGHALAKGAQLDRMFAELCGRESGYCHGRGGSMHIADVSVGMLGANGIVGGSCSIAVGAAVSSQLRGLNQAVACFFGDAASNQGSFHESVNLAATWKLPVLFVCENNGYGVSTPINTTISVENVSDRAKGYGIPGVTVDGQDVEAVYAAASKLLARAKGGEGPAILECKTYRYEGHFFGDPGIYRTKEEVEHWKQDRDPVRLYRDKLAKQGFASDVESIEQKVDAEIAESAQWALQQPIPDVDSITNLVYAGDTPFPDLSGRRRVYEGE